MQQTAEYIATHHDFFGQSHQQAEHKGSKQIQRIELKASYFHLTQSQRQSEADQVEKDGCQQSVPQSPCMTFQCQSQVRERAALKIEQNHCRSQHSQQHTGFRHHMPQQSGVPCLITKNQR